MKEEPFFLVNEFVEKERKELENIINLVEEGHTKHFERAMFIKEFARGLFLAYRNSKNQDQKDLESEKQKLKEELLKRKQELLQKLEAHKKLLDSKKEINVEKKELIKSKESGKTFVTTEFIDGAYFVREPELKSHDVRILNELKKLNIDSKEKLRAELKQLCDKNKLHFSDSYLDIMRYYLIRDKKRYGRITPLIEDKDISEIICQGASKHIIITYKGKEDTTTNVIFESDEQINVFIKNIAQKTKEDLTDEKPFLKVILENMGISANLGTQFLKPKFVIVKQQ